MEKIDNLMKMRHTLSHILAGAVLTEYPEAKFGVGPAIETGFYYDIDFGDKKVSDKDLARIEKKMRGIVKRGFRMEREVRSREEAVKWAKEAKQYYKVEIIGELPDGEEISFYKLIVDDKVIFEDLCRGGHAESAKEIGAFKLEKVAGAYWRGDEKREMMTRIYGVAFEKEEELADYLERQEEAKKRDHRKLGKELDLFCFSDLVGSGLPMFTPRGAILRKMVADFSLSLREREGFYRVWTPHITKMDLYKRSGHYDKFGDELFLVNSQVNGEEFALKPMNCPHHTQIYASLPKSYKELPVRYMEETTDYRDEKSGELGGLSRVRALTQDDSHVFCRKEQIGEEIRRLVAIVKELYAAFEMKELRARLSYRNDEDKYLGDKDLWAMAQKKIREVAESLGLDFFEMEGEAAFYGPKIDFMATDALGREHQVATVQLDFVQPERFGLEFMNEKGEKETPVMIHHATLGSVERFISVLIEHTGGWLPFWCAPEQLRILTVGEVSDYVAEITEILSGVKLEKPLANNKIRFIVDDSGDSLGKKIKKAVGLKIPVVMIVGEKDKEERVVTVRVREGERKIGADKLVDYLRDLK